MACTKKAMSAKKFKERDSFINDFSLKRLKELGNVTFNNYDRNYTTEELKQAIKGVDIVFCGWGSGCFDQEVLQSADKLKIIAYCAGSVSGIATPAIYEKGIAMLGANCVFAESVAESCVCYTMVGLRRIEYYANRVRKGFWQDQDFYNQGIMDRTIGLVGFGAIAKKFVEFLKPFRNRILVYSNHLTQEEAQKYGVEKVSLDQIFIESDVVSIHQSLTEKTYHLIKKEHFDKMKDGALLINTARGAIIDQKDLVEVLKTGRINAVLDVLEQEPPEPNSILTKLENVTILPHMGGPTMDRRPYCVTKLVDDIQKLLAGEKLENLETYIPLSHLNNMTVQPK